MFAVPANVRLVNVATPLDVETVVVPPSVPPLADTSIDTEAVVTTLLPESRTLTTGCVERSAPAVFPTGCVVIAICVAAPTVGITDCVATVRALPPYVAEYVMVYAVPAVPVIPRSSNVATPLDAVAVRVPTSVAPALTEAVTTVELSIVTTLFPESCNDT